MCLKLVNVMLSRDGNNVIIVAEKIFHLPSSKIQNSEGNLLIKALEAE